MTDEQLMQKIRQDIEVAIQHGPITQELMFIYLQLKMIDKLDDILVGLAEVEQEIAKLSPDTRWST